MVRTVNNVTFMLTVLVMLAALAACGGKSSGKSAAPVQSVAAAVRDLGGIEIVIGNWWADWDVNTFKANSAEAERTLEWRKEIQKKYNFKIREAHISSWDQMQEITSTSIMAGDPAASIFLLQPNWGIAVYKQGLLASVTEASSIDFSETAPVEWNQDVRNTFTFNNKTHAFAVGYGTSQHGSGVFFNKRLFQEAGIDPNLPYDLQKSGRWTWDAFLDICKQLTRDINNDGIIDIYAMASSSDDLLDAVVASNGAYYVDKEASGNFINATGKPEFLQALQFAVRLRTEGYQMAQPAGSEWNWYEPVFHDGKAAMRVAQQYVAQQLADMTDDWGFVLFPKGPHVSDYIVSSDENICVVPSTFSAEEIDKIMFGYKLWVTPAPGNDDPDTWKEGQYHIYRDSRAIDETLQMLREPKHNVMKYFTLIPGLQRGDISWNMWNEGTDPAQLIESVQQSWNSLINEMNRVK